MTTFTSLRRVCAALPHAEHERKWDDVDAWMVRRKMFAIFVVDARGRPRECWFKVDADRFLELTDRPGMRPAPYLARAGWIALGAPDRFALAELRPLIERSHRLVVAGLSMTVQRALGFEPMRRQPARAPRLVRDDPGAQPRFAGRTVPRLVSSGPGAPMGEDT
ncbi:MAG: hypothetical protein RJA99_4876 [Pseudomonadota bacterium]|jgi:predicted DNA-binding protein (MmcQ/YjbR family)